MAITYIEKKFGLASIKIPKLHRVHYGTSVDGIYAKYQKSLRDYQIDSWLKENCRAPYYHSTYHFDKFIQFEDDEDAVMFALMWGR